ncbi:hypothetical protein FRB95_013698 [Tulasnella sp. JGI-2019a]|nr:hypothetical protein FRB93_000677 [Tulasnella sp. JGI-2019a]KAG9034179.1 hypothetical protein FRB95_013698 [Tulasnella sp. JGI-2019a]
MLTPFASASSGSILLFRRNNTDTTTESTNSTDNGSPKTHEVVIIVSIIAVAVLIWIGLGISFIRHLRRKKPVQETVGGVPIHWPGRDEESAPAATGVRPPIIEKSGEEVSRTAEIEAPPAAAVSGATIPDVQTAQPEHDRPVGDISSPESPTSIASPQSPTWMLEVPPQAHAPLTSSSTGAFDTTTRPVPFGQPPDYDDAIRPSYA